ncbi:putative metalloprotease CJM1_0395 family protein [Allochromatium palmeri]
MAQVRDPALEDPRAIEETAETEAERSTEDQDPTAETGPDGETLASDDQRMIEQLKQRDTEVRAHEQAHVAAGGGNVTSGPSYSYQTGPDGKRYAIGGEVGINTSMSSGDPEGNLEKARAIIRAAMAPAEPSSQDVRVAASARSMEVRAQQEIRERQIQEYEAVMSASAGDRDSTSAAETSRNSVTDSAMGPSSGMTGGQARLARQNSSVFAASVGAGLSQLA